MDQRLQDAAAPGQRLGQAPADRPPRARRDDIPGWGVDLAPEDRPAYPMERRPPRLESMPQGDPVPQPLHCEVFHSSERPGVTPIFGTSTPPSGVSGRLRRVAYGYSENDVRHWQLLLLADRVNVAEGVLSDLARGRLPNLYREMGGPAELRHNPAGAARKAAAVAAVAAIGILWWTGRRRGAAARR